MQPKADSFARITRKRKGKVVCTSKVPVKLTLKDMGNESFTETRKTGDKANETESKCIRRVRQRVRATLHLCEARLPLRWPLPLPILFCDENFPYQEQLTTRCHRGRSEHSVWISRRPAGRDLRSLQRDGYSALRCQGPLRLGQLQSWAAGLQCTGSHV